MDLARDWELNLDVRRIGPLPDPASPAYTELDSRLSWTVSRGGGEAEALVGLPESGR